MAPSRMTPEEEEARISELAKLIAQEKNPDKVKDLAAELEHLLTIKLERAKEKRGK